MTSFPRTARLTRPREFREVFAQPIRFGDRLVTVLVRANGLDHPRLGLAVSRRRIGGAAARNRFKRIVRESFRSRAHELGGCDAVVLPKAAAADAPPRELRASIDRQWELLKRRRIGEEPAPSDPAPSDNGQRRDPEP